MKIELKGQYSSWVNVKAGVPQGSILGSIFFLIFINNLSDNFVSIHKQAAVETALFSVVLVTTLSAKKWWSKEDKQMGISVENGF